MTCRSGGLDDSRLSANFNMNGTTTGPLSKLVYVLLASLQSDISYGELRQSQRCLYSVPVAQLRKAKCAVEVTPYFVTEKRSATFKENLLEILVSRILDNIGAGLPADNCRHVSDRNDVLLKIGM